MLYSLFLGDLTFNPRYKYGIYSKSYINEKHKLDSIYMAKKDSLDNKFDNLIENYKEATE